MQSNIEMFKNIHLVKLLDSIGESLIFADKDQYIRWIKKPTNDLLEKIGPYIKVQQMVKKGLKVRVKTCQSFKQGIQYVWNLKGYQLIKNRLGFKKLHFFLILSLLDGKLFYFALINNYLHQGGHLIVEFCKEKQI